jgi:hypothetical protein
MSGVMIAISAGLGPAFAGLWLRGWALGFLVSFPTARLVAPPIVKWSQRLG